MTLASDKFIVREAKSEDIPSIISICRSVYPSSPPWTAEQLHSHQKIFPEGQLVISSRDHEEIVGLASSLIVRWDDYDWDAPWRDFTEKGMFTNHDPIHGRTLYGAEVMIHPKTQGTGAGTLLYLKREELARRLGLLRIRAGARLRGYHRFASQMTAEDYVLKVVNGEIKDLTLSFQLKRGFQVLRIVENYLLNDPESLGFAAIIEWINLDVALPSDYNSMRNSKFYLKK